MAAPIALPLRTVLTLLRRRGVEPHAVFATTASWHSEDALRVLDAETDEVLQRLELTVGRRLHRDLESALRALDRPHREYYGWIDTTIDGSPRSYSVIAAHVDDHAVVSVHDHGTDVVVLAPVRGEQLPEEFAAQIPPHRTTRAASVNAPYQEFLRTSTRSPSSGARTLKELFATPRTGAGNLYSAVRTPGGRKRIEHPVNYIDTADGRWLTLLSDSGGQRWATATPATPALIAQRLVEAADVLVGAEEPSSFVDPYGR